jgi:hypothetical protein
MNELNVHDKEQFGCTSLINVDLKNKTDQYVTANGHFTLDDIHEKFSQISCSLIH